MIALKPLHIAMGLMAACLWLGQNTQEGLFSQAHWLGLGLILFSVTLWPTRQLGFLMVSIGLWLVWGLISPMLALMQSEVLIQSTRLFDLILFPATYSDKRITVTAWMLAMLPLALGMNLDFRNGGKSYRLAGYGALLGAAFVPFLSGMMEGGFWLAFTAAIIPAWMMGVAAAPRERIGSQQGLKLLALLFPLALLFHALPLPTWLEMAALGMLSIRLLSPAPSIKLAWAALAAALMWALASWGMPDWPVAFKVMLMGLSLVLVGGPWYTWNWVSVLVLSGSVLLGIGLLSWSHLEIEVWMQLAIGMPLLIAALLYSDRGSRRWTLPAPEK